MKSKLQERREALGMDRDALVKVSGISLQSIIRIEQGSIEHRTHVGVALALADALECEMGDLFDIFDLTHLGRPPHTGTPIKQDTPKRHLELFCDSCFLYYPAHLSCEGCGQHAVH